jgi:hypothetical protein
MSNDIVQWIIFCGKKAVSMPYLETPISRCRLQNLKLTSLVHVPFFPRPCSARQSTVVNKPLFNITSITKARQHLKIIVYFARKEPFLRGLMKMKSDQGTIL